jgi:phosphoribosylformylglycinamidine synthase
MVGLVADAERTARAAFPGEGATILLLGDGEPELEGSEYLALRHGKTGDRPPAIDLAAERRLGELCCDLIAEGVTRSAHDVADGGLAIALAEMSLTSRIGCRVDARMSGRADVALFGESGCRILLAVEPGAAAKVEARARAAGVSCRNLGTTGGERVTVRDGATGKILIDASLVQLRTGWEATLPAIAHADAPEAARAAGG